MATLITPVRCQSMIYNKYTRTDMVGILDAGSSSSVSRLAVQNSKDLIKNPNWKALVAKRLDASSSYSRIEQEYRQMFIRASSWGYPVGGSKVIKSEGNCFGVAYWDPSAYIDNSNDANLQAIALQRLKKKIKSASVQANILVPVVELRELRRTVVSLMNSTSSVLIAVLTARKTGGRSVAKTISDLWLTYSFGIKPVLNDIAEISKAVNEMVNGHERSIVLRGSSNKEWVTSTKNVTGFAPFGCSFSGVASFSHSLSYRYTAGLNLNLRSANNYGVDSQLGVNLEGIPSVLWELTTLSWIADYFANVGSYLDDTFSTDANQTKFCVLNRRYTCKVRIDGRIYPASSSHYVMSSRIKPGDYSYLNFSRTPYGTTIPSTSLRFKSVDEIGKNAGNKLANLLSVFASQSVGNITPKGPFRA